jgi:hypothetical protein
VCDLNDENTAQGQGALAVSGCTAPTGAQDNAAFGFNALGRTTTGSSNTASGHGALSFITTGNNNIALGTGAGSALTDQNDNIDIGNAGVAEDQNTIRIGTEAQPSATPTTVYIAGIKDTTLAAATPVYVLIDPATGQLGTSVTPPGGPAPAIGQLNQDIKTMDAAIAQQRDEFKALVAEQRKSIEILTARVKAQDDQLQRVTVRMEQNRARSTKVANTR